MRFMKEMLSCEELRGVPLGMSRIHSECRDPAGARLRQEPDDEEEEEEEDGQEDEDDDGEDDDGYSE